MPVRSSGGDSGHIVSVGNPRLDPVCHTSNVSPLAPAIWVETQKDYSDWPLKTLPLSCYSPVAEGILPFLAKPGTVWAVSIRNYKRNNFSGIGCRQTARHGFSVLYGRPHMEAAQERLAGRSSSFRTTATLPASTLTPWRASSTEVWPRPAASGRVTDSPAHRGRDRLKQALLLTVGCNRLLRPSWNLPLLRSPQPRKLRIESGDGFGRGFQNRRREWRPRRLSRSLGQ